MPFKSKAQRRKFAELLVKGEISPETYEEWNRETGTKKLPERLGAKKKTVRKRGAKENSCQEEAMTPRVLEQIAFLVEADKLKTILRRTPLADASRLENSAEHSWHLALAAMILAEHAPPGVDVARVLELVVIHDLVEIDAGDTFAYDPEHTLSKAVRERAAADRIFGILPPEQDARIRALWEEFEAHQTPESRFANALDRFQALLLNYRSGGGSWTQHGVKRSQVLERMAPVHDALPDLWPYVVDVIDRATAGGLISRG